MEQEISKHRKKRPSSISKSRARVRHKHAYKECLFMHKVSPIRGRYCTICGRIKSLHYLELTNVDGFSRAMTDLEILEKYKKL